MKLLDCRGQSCPLPVLDTKKLIEEESPKSLQVVVDSEVPRDNVRRFLESRGYVVTVEPSVIRIKRNGSSPSSTARRWGGGMIS
jgi:TusA-related sulfurtransferase